MSLKKTCPVSSSPPSVKNRWIPTAHLSEWPKSETLILPQMLQGYGATGILIADGNAKWYKIKYTLTRGSSNHVPWHLPKGDAAYDYTKTCTQIFIAVLLISAKTWKPPIYPSVGEWIHKLCYIQIMEYYSMLKRSELSWKPWKVTLNAYYY